ncbi:MAG: tetratricopeptide repeat protein [Alphaproteobacteria bacterium]|nr:tetratricopeptide repeat protein [Alphaproteobacteria bacterium]
MKLIAGSLVLLLTVAGVSSAGSAQVNDFLWPGRTISSGDGDYENGVNAARAGDWQMSVRFLERSVGRDPQDADALTMLAFGNSQLGRLGPAMRYYRAALTIDPEHRLANLRIGEAYLAANNVTKARQHWKTLSRLCPSGCAELNVFNRALAAYRITGPNS